MNPFKEYTEFRPEHLSFTEGCLISVASHVGHGKSVCLNSMAINYLQNGVDVLCIAEDVKIKWKIQNEVHEMSLNSACGHLHFIQMVNFRDRVGFFVTVLNNFLSQRMHHKRKFVIIIDGPLFDTEEKGFDFTNLGANTRRVIIEKFNKKNQFSDLKYQFGTDKVTHTQRMYMRNNALTDLTQHFGCHVVITDQINRTGAMHTMTSAMVFTVYKQDFHRFNLALAKNRYGQTEDIQECVLNTNNLTLEKLYKFEFTERLYMSKLF